MPDERLQYPIGKFSAKENYTTEEIGTLISAIENLPGNMEGVLKKLSPQQLDTPYRPGGWTARQVIHHVADSHMNAYIRFKWSLTEDTPLIKAYNEKLWAETYETKMDPALSMSLIKSLHVKWITLLRSLSKDDLQKSFLHPETGKHVRLDRLIALYAWHGEHHLGHLKIVLG
ncbi:MAG TPA: putative metal-dependent hydrolase [Cyclobacteriaceae bacterium]|nr:putative metal-dependent hydrolase [Cyclobacteriaceae bacterium]